MQKKLVSIFIFGLIAVVLVVLAGGLRLAKISPTAYAVGDLTIDWGVPSGNPIFVINNMLPGDSESRDVDVSNGAVATRGVGVWGVKTSETANFSTILDFVISENGSDLYGGTSSTGLKTLADFFAESGGPTGIFLSDVSPGDTTTYTFKASFPAAAGNEFQDAEVIFDVVIGISIPVPAECAHIAFSGPPIFGTSGDDEIDGTLGNDFIVLFEGNDRSFGFLGDDCITGGSGNDELRGEVGKDILFGNDGDDLLIGANDEDKIFGGDGNDTIRGENDDDYIEGNEGNDTITGGNGDDLINGGDGNDTISAENGEDEINGGAGDDNIDGGSGDDQIHGDGGNDSMNGKAGDDAIIGDSDIDSADGLSGTDTCDAETETNCEL